MAPAYKAYVYEAIGDAAQQIKLRTNVSFTPLKPTEVRIRVASAALNPADWKLIEYGAPFLPTTPTIEKPIRIGFDVSGQVTEVGAEVKGFKNGDLVYSCTEMICRGTFAEFVDLEEKYVAHKPANLSHDEAAAVPLAALTSYQGIVQYAGVQPGQRVLVLGGSGGCGIMGVQMAKALGAYVVATSSFRNAEFIKSIGADEVIDYTTTKWADVLAEHSIDAIYDCGVDVNSWNAEAQKVLKEGGHFVTLLRVKDPVESPIGAQLNQMFCYSSGEQLASITKWLDEGALKVYIDSVYPFEKLIEAVERLKTSRARGKVVIKVQDL